MSLGVNDAKFLRAEAEMYRSLRDDEKDEETRDFFHRQAKVLDAVADGIDDALGLLEFAMETTDDTEFAQEIADFID